MVLIHTLYLKKVIFLKVWIWIPNSASLSFVIVLSPPAHYLFLLRKMSHLRSVLLRSSNSFQFLNRLITCQVQTFKCHYSSKAYLAKRFWWSLILPSAYQLTKVLKLCKKCWHEILILGTWKSWIPATALTTIRLSPQLHANWKEIQAWSYLVVEKYS